MVLCPSYRWVKRNERSAPYPEGSACAQLGVKRLGEIYKNGSYALKKSHITNMPDWGEHNLKHRQVITDIQVQIWTQNILININRHQQIWSATRLLEAGNFCLWIRKAALISLWCGRMKGDRGSKCRPGTSRQVVAAVSIVSDQHHFSKCCLALRLQTQ